MKFQINLMILRRIYQGEVINIDDPKKEWRIKVDIKGLFSTPNSDEDVDPDKLPWIYPMNRGFDAGETPKVGQKVIVEFDGNFRNGWYRSWEEISETFKEEIGKDYEGYKSIVHDEEEKLNIRYTKGKGVEVILDKSFIQIEPNGVIRHSFNDGQRVIEMNSSGVSIVSDKIFSGSLNNSKEASCLGETNKAMLDSLWDAINKINNDLKQYGLAQSQMAQGVLSPLKAQLIMLSQKATENASTNESTKSKTPETLSKVNKLD